jgi:hypothetical protein
MLFVNIILVVIFGLYITDARSVGVYDGVGFDNARCTTHAQCACIKATKSVMCANRDVSTFPYPHSYWGQNIENLDVSRNAIVNVEESVLGIWTSLKLINLRENPLSQETCARILTYVDTHPDLIILTDCHR